MEIGYLLSAVLFVALFIFQVVKKWTGADKDYAVGFMCLFSSAWAFVTYAASVEPESSYVWVQMAEFAKTAATYLMLLSFLGVLTNPKELFSRGGGMSALSISLSLTLVPALQLFWRALSGVEPTTPEKATVPTGPYDESYFLTWLLLLSIAGLVLLEQIVRNAKHGHRWHLKYLGIGLGICCAFDTYMYTDALLLGDINGLLWSVRGYLYALSAFFIGLTFVRTSALPLQVNFSRKIVFHSSMMLLSGIYLMSMSMLSFLLKKYTANWGQIQQGLFWSVAGASLLVLVSSGRFRSYLKYYVTRNLFSTKYDYREEWVRISKTLALSSADSSLAERAITALAECVDSPGGGLWLSRDEHFFEQEAHVEFGWIEDSLVAQESRFIEFLVSRKWIIDLTDEKNELRKGDYPKWLLQLTKMWLVVPLVVDERLIGFILLKHSRVPRKLSWEELDLLRAAAQQASSYLGLMLATEALLEANQFSAFNQMSAFVVHDLKTLNSQLSLMVANAPKHKSNPSFVDDMIVTSAHVVDKLNALLMHLKNTKSDARDNGTKVDLVKLLGEIVSNKKRHKASLKFDGVEGAIHVYAKLEELSAALGHIIQNAIDATSERGDVEIRLEKDDRFVKVLIKDSGVGMTPEFVRTKLFRPFESTKGLSGMGIGAFQSREYVRRLGGNIAVKSQTGVGSEFLVTLPLMDG